MDSGTVVFFPDLDGGSVRAVGIEQWCRSRRLRVEFRDVEVMKGIRRRGLKRNEHRDYTEWVDALERERIDARNQ